MATCWPSSAPLRTTTQASPSGKIGAGHSCPAGRHLDAGGDFPNAVPARRTPGTPPTREGIILHVAPTALSWTADRGQTWRRLDGPGTGYYPHAAQLDDGTILAVGHTGNDDPYGKTDQAIVLNRIRLEVR